MKFFRVDEEQADKQFFRVLGGTGKCQIASMILKPGQVSGEYGTEHPQSDQILFVMDGNGFALTESEKTQIGAGDLILIEAGEEHQIGCEGTVPLRTLNFYSPPAY
ncbi:MAG TPA: cupin domain-containing protein [Fimbriimonadaceae bacterium]